MKQGQSLANRILGWISLILTLLLIGCQAPVQAPVAESSEALNDTPNQVSLSADSIAGQLQLDEVAEIQILAFDEGSGDWSAAGEPITEPSTINEIVAALNQPLTFTPRARCPAQYRLLFQLPENQTAELSYMCSDETQIVRGDQPFWNDQDGEAPAAFVAVMEQVLAGR